MVGLHRPSDCNLINGFYFVCIQNITRLAGHARKENMLSSRNQQHLSLLFWSFTDFRVWYASKGNKNKYYLLDTFIYKILYGNLKGMYIMTYWVFRFILLLIFCVLHIDLHFPYSMNITKNLNINKDVKWILFGKIYGFSYIIYA